MTTKKLKDSMMKITKKVTHDRVGLLISETTPKVKITLTWGRYRDSITVRGINDDKWMRRLASAWVALRTASPEKTLGEQLDVVAAALNGAKVIGQVIPRLEQCLASIPAFGK